MKSARGLPRDDVTIRILSLARAGVTKEIMQEAIALPSHQFQREVAALVDRELLHLDAKRDEWITTDKGMHFYKMHRRRIVTEVSLRTARLVQGRLQNFEAAAI